MINLDREVPLRMAAEEARKSAELARTRAAVKVQARTPGQSAAARPRFSPGCQNAQPQEEDS